MTDTVSPLLINLTAQVVVNFVAANKVDAGALPELVKSVHSALSRLGEETEAPTPEAAIDKPTKAQIRRSIGEHRIVSFEDGKGYRSLKRHLSSRGMTMEFYKAKWGLPNDYPSVHPTYSEARSAMAKTIGLGRKGAAARKAGKAVGKQEPAKAAPAKRGRKPKAAATPAS